MNKTLQEIQSELKVWTEYNFGKQTPEIPILGMIEELGELSHSILKEKQGIRQSDFLADKKDAIADLTIYALNYLNSIRTTYEHFVSHDLGLLSNIQDICFNIYELNHVELFDTTNDRDNCNIIISRTQQICNNLSIDFLTTVNEVWEQVKLRDWKKYPKDGKTN